jgi:hypothetical protein
MQQLALLVFQMLPLMPSVLNWSGAVLCWAEFEMRLFHMALVFPQLVAEIQPQATS